MNKLIGLVVAGIVVVVGGTFAYFNFIRDDAPEAFELTDNSEGDSAEDDTDDADREADGADNPDTTAAVDAVGLDGTWSVADDSEAGYRVVEDLSGIQDFEAVGRTGDVSGTIEIEGTTVLAGQFDVAVASITSDDGRRDRTFANDVMEVGRFPTATLRLTEPIDLGAIPDDGAVVNTAAAGELTLRDVTNAAPIEVAAQLLGDQIEIVASIPVLFSDYGIDNPSNAFVSVRDEGKVEVRLLLSRE